MLTRNYELMYILKPELSEEEIDTLQERIRNYLAEAGGHIFQDESWGLRRLAYTIQQCREGRYYLIRFTIEPNQISEFERNLLLVEGVLRELITRYDGPVTQQKEPEPPTEQAETSAEAEAEEEEAD